MTNRNRILPSLAVLVLCSVFAASPALAADVTIGGKVLALETSQAPVVGATVSVHPAGTPSTTTGGDGSWSLTVSDASDPVLKIGATATTVETYTTFPLSLLMLYQSGPYQYDISAVTQASFTGAGVPSTSCLVVGFALQYTSLGYPAAQNFLSGVQVSPTPLYIAADGVNPCYTCTATTASGAWVGVHVAPYSTSYIGIIPDPGGSCAAAAAVTLSGGDVTCVANTANVTGLVHPTLP